MLAPVRFAITVVICLPAACQTDWPVSPPGKQGFDPAILARLDAHIQSKLPHLRSLLIARHGRLVYERYYGDASRDGPHNMHSMTKSLSSALVGIALKKGYIGSLEEKALGYLPGLRGAAADPRAANITIRNLLTMSSGIDEIPLSFDKGRNDPLRDVVGRLLIFKPGAGFRYSSAAAHVLGGVLRAATRQSVFTFAQTELFRPLGMEQITWYADSTGLQSGGMSALFRSRDILKFGELYLRRGKWHGSELIAPAFIEDSVKEHNTGDFYGEKARYGYMWWIADTGYYARGYGGQYLMVIPKADMVVLCTSDWKRPEYPEHFALMNDFVLPAAR